MIKVNDDLYIIDKEHTLVFCQDTQDQKGKGWFILKDFSDDRTTHKSQYFTTKELALTAFERGQVNYK